MIEVSDLNIDFKDGKIITNLTGLKLFDLYRYVTSAFLDGVMPVMKIIGFRIIDSENLNFSGILDRHTSLLDNPVEIGNNMDKMVITGKNDAVLLAELKPGEVKSKDLDLVWGYDPLIPDTHIMTVKSYPESSIMDEDTLLRDEEPNLMLEIVVRKATGYHTMEDNVKFMMSEFAGREDSYDGIFNVSDYIPVNSSHTLSPYINFIPFVRDEDKDIRYKLKGITDENLKKLWDEYLSTII